MALDPNDPKVQRALLARAKALRAELARRDPDVFMSLVLRDEETGNAVEQGPYHSKWQQMITKNKRSIIWSHVESGKTQQISIGRVLWEIGNNHGLRVVIVSNTGGQSSKIVKSIKSYVEDSKEVHEVFPDLKPGKQWSGDSLVVERDSHAKDPTVQAIGMHGNILGARIDLLILDDVIDYENSRTEYQRGEAMHWIESTLFGRMTRHGRIVFIGNAWHIEDAMHTLSMRKGWNAGRFAVVDPKTGKTSWPDRWDDARIEDKKDELGPLEFARQMMCEARAEGESRFRQEDINKCLARGRAKAVTHALQEIPEGAKVFTGVDLAVSRKRTAAQTVLFTILVHRDNTREVLNIESGRWTADEIIQHLHSTYRRYGGEIRVENNQAQDFIVQLAAKNLPVKPFTTGRNKTHPVYGVESLSAEIARAQWIIPSATGPDGGLHPDIQAWVDEMLYYDPTQHTGDRLMAGWIAREAARRARGCHRIAGFSSPNGEENNVYKQDLSDRMKSSAAGKNAAIWDDIWNLVG